MLLRLDSGNEVYLDGLCLETILSTFSARDLAILTRVCQTMRAPAQLAAHRSLQLLVHRLQSTLLRHCECGSWIFQLHEWEALAAANLVWLQADEKHTTLVVQGDQRLIKHAHDLSGHGNAATMSSRMPALRPSVINGHSAFEFDGSSVLKTRPFAEALPQPITIMVVARLRGDTTICDSLSPTSDRFELCHGYPSGWHPSPEICMTASGLDTPPRNSLRGSTRSTGEWHVYTAIYDHRRSEIYVDGYCEASGKSAGNNSLDGLSIGCDHTGVFYLSGSLAELRLFHCHMPSAQRVQTEAALAQRYGIQYSSQPSPPQTPRKSPSALSALSRFSCAPLSPLRTSGYA